ncbi:unnamed protein product, partial [Amoebophrya sp. A25]
VSPREFSLRIPLTVGRGGALSAKFSLTRCAGCTHLKRLLSPLMWCEAPRTVTNTVGHSVYFPFLGNTTKKTTTIIFVIITFAIVAR